MSFKDQTQCYRTIKGVKWPNFCDILEDSDQADVDAFKASGGRVAIRTHPDGYKQAFVHPDDLDKWNKEGVSE